MSDRPYLELIEADVEQGFSLVDMAEEEVARGNYLSVNRILLAAQTVLADIDQRISMLRSEDAGPFLPLLQELRRSIESSRSQIPNP